ncbi:MAG: hypothetical protein LAP86_25855 [Acidobacteriia bacterium]|nr:hypothetical protein [Terriglobia bacterium]
MIHSSRNEPIPEPSPRYKLIAEALRDCGQDVNDRDFEAIDAIATDENAGPEEPAIWLDQS